MNVLGYPQIENDFTQYQIEGGSFLLTTLQRAHLQNELALAAQQQLAITFDPTNPNQTGLDMARLTGWTQAIKFLLDVAQTNSENLRNKSQSQSQSQE